MQFHSWRFNNNFLTLFFNLNLYININHTKKIFGREKKQYLCSNGGEIQGKFDWKVCYEWYVKNATNHKCPID